MAFIRDIAIPTVKGWVSGKRVPVVPVVPLKGVIGQMGPMRRGLTMENLADPLNRAFKIKGAGTVALIVNSPGGSPVQSALIAKRIRQLAEENDVKVIAFCEDVAASGGYWLAVAADEIVVDDNSIIGSIGVISSGFGFKEAMKKLGVERRLHTAGENKSFLDPFLPETKKDVDRLKTIQSDMHDSFKEFVTSRRGEELSGDPDLFTGAFWTGRRAVDLGLADAVGEIRGTLRERFGEDVRMPVIKARRSWLQSRFGSSNDRAAVWVDGMLSAVEERMIWDRFRF